MEIIIIRLVLLYLAIFVVTALYIIFNYDKTGEKPDVVESMADVIAYSFLWPHVLFVSLIKIIRNGK
jgi:hypothetical protein